MRVFFSLLILSFLILPVGCGGVDDSSGVNTDPVQEPTGSSPEELNKILPPPPGEGGSQQ